MNIIDFTAKFHKLESDNDFFETKDSKGLLYWDLARYEVFNQLYFELSGINLPAVEIKRKKTEVIKSILNFIKGYIIMKMKLLKPYEYVFFVASRNKDKQGRPIDIISTDPLAYIYKQSLIIDSFAVKNEKGDKSYDIVYNFDLIVEQYICRISKKIKRENQVYNYTISDILQKAFNVKLDINSIINEAISTYEISESYYFRLLRKIQPKGLFLIQYGIQKGLFAAANKLKIPIVELQHGLIGYVHPAYSYPEQIKPGTLKTLPDAFFSFSDFWTKNINYPVNKILPLGNSFYASKMNSEHKKYDLTFIFANIYKEDLLKFVNSVLEKEYKGKICIKLHPNQLHEADLIAALYKQYDTIEIVGIENSMGEILSLSKSIVAIVSTSVYEALQNGLKVFLIKEKNYMTHLDIFDNPNVYLVDTVGDILDSVDKEFIVSQEYTMFQRFNEGMFLQYLNSL